MTNQVILISEAKVEEEFEAKVLKEFREKGWSVTLVHSVEEALKYEAGQQVWLIDAQTENIYPFNLRDADNRARMQRAVKGSKKSERDAYLRSTP